MMQDQKSLTLRWRWYTAGSHDIVTRIFAYNAGQYLDYGLILLNFQLRIMAVWLNIVDAPLRLIFSR